MRKNLGPRNQGAAVRKKIKRSPTTNSKKLKTPETEKSKELTKVIVDLAKRYSRQVAG